MRAAIARIAPGDPAATSGQPHLVGGRERFDTASIQFIPRFLLTLDGSSAMIRWQN
jgi:hypothetical protein